MLYKRVQPFGCYDVFGGGAEADEAVTEAKYKDQE